jgi:glycine cleavage system H protein
MHYKFPNELKYTTTHEWVKFTDQIATIGITEYAQNRLGDIVFIELPDIGMIFEKESHVGDIESVKAVGDLIMPLSGEIIDINKILVDNPELINSSPFGEGWILKIKISHPSEMENLLSAEDYKELVKSEEI